MPSRHQIGPSPSQTRVGVQVKWEPFDWGRRSRALAVTSHTVQQAKLGVRDAEDRATLEINSRLRTLAEKRALLERAAAERAWICLEHGPEVALGRPVLRDDDFGWAETVAPGATAVPAPTHGET